MRDRENTPGAIPHTEADGPRSEPGDSKRPYITLGYL